MDPKDKILGRKYKAEYGMDMTDLINAGYAPADISMDAHHTKTIYDVSETGCKNSDSDLNCGNGQGMGLDGGNTTYGGMNQTHSSCSTCGSSGGCSCGSSSVIENCDGSKCFVKNNSSLDEYGYPKGCGGCNSCGGSGWDCGCDSGCDDCDAPNTCKEGCGDREKCAINCSTMRSYKLAREVNSRGDKEVDGIGFKVFDFTITENNEAGIHGITTSCGDHPLVFDCTKEPIHKDAMKVCTLNEFYFDPENCRYQFLYRFLGIPDPGDGGDTETPLPPGATDVLIKFLHPRYDMRFKIGFYLNDVDMEWIKRDAGRIIHACLWELLDFRTNDEIRYTPTGVNGNMAEVDFYRVAQLLTYKDGDYADDNNNYGIVMDRPQSTRTQEPPITRWKTKLCPKDADIICLGETVTQAELKGFLRYEAKPYMENGVWFYRLWAVLENGRMFLFSSSSENVENGCGGGEVCLGENWQEIKICGKSLSGCDLGYNTRKKIGHIKQGCVSIQGFFYSWNKRIEVPVSGNTDNMTLCWFELVSNSCGEQNIEFKYEIINYMSKSSMKEIGDYFYDNRALIVPICAFQYVPPGAKSADTISINDYRQYIDMNEIRYEQQYSTYAANRYITLCTFGTINQFSCNLHFSTRPEGGATTTNVQCRIVGGESLENIDAALTLTQERGLAHLTNGTNATINQDYSGNRFGEWFGLGWSGGYGTGGSNHTNCIFGDLSFDVGEGVRYASNSAGGAFLTAQNSVSQYVKRTAIPTVTKPYRIDFRCPSTDVDFQDFHIKSSGSVTSNRLPIWFVGIREQD